ncbi:hypothetical protein B1T45_06855, partial [Mycobacterium kansasii]
MATAATVVGADNGGVVAGSSGDTNIATAATVVGDRTAATVVGADNGGVVAGSSGDTNIATAATVVGDRNAG